MIGRRKIHCKRGHFLTEKNTEPYYNRQKGSHYRRCVECKPLRKAEAVARI